MSGIFSTFNIANKGLQAAQTALQTVSHNISNANTEGFSRQRVDLKADLAFNFAGVGQLGTGVKMESIVRLVDDYVSKQIRQENSTLNRYDTKSETLSQLEIIFNEPSDTGLNFNLAEMFTAWQELSKNPEGSNFKTIVVEKSNTLTDTINHMMSQLNSLEGQTSFEVGKTVDDFNSIITQLDTLNQQIYKISAKGQIPNDLMDQRDLMLKRLSSIADFKVEFDKFNRAIVKIEGREVLGPDADFQLKTDENMMPILVKEDNTETIKAEDFLKSGKLKGYMEAIDDIKARRSEFNEFAKNLAQVINEVHEAGENEIPFFVFDENNPASTIKVNDEILKNNNLVNTKMAGGSEGDGSLALEIARLRNKKLESTNATIEGTYRDIVIKVGISKEHADNMVSNQEVLLNQLVLRRESTSGVSINEEVTNLIQFQKSFEANAKVISVLTEMLDTLINRTGV